VPIVGVATVSTRGLLPLSSGANRRAGFDSLPADQTTQPQGNDMKSPPLQNMNSPQPDGSSDYIHDLADHIAADPIRMGEAIKRDDEPLWSQSYADLIMAMVRSIPHQAESDAYRDCMQAVSQAWQQLAHEEAKRLFKMYGTHAAELLEEQEE